MWALVVGGRRVSAVRRESTFCLVREVLDQLYASEVVEAEALEAKRERLVEAWDLFHEMVTRGHRENEAA